MNSLHHAWMPLMIVTPLLGAAWVARCLDPLRAQRRAVLIGILTLVWAAAAWLDFQWLTRQPLLDAGAERGRWTGSWMGIDELNAPLLPLSSLLYLLVTVATVRTKVQRFSFAGNLVAQSILLATLCCQFGWGIAALLAAGCVPPYMELRARHRRTRLYVLHMLLFAGLLVGGLLMIDSAPRGADVTWGATLLVAAVLLRSGIVPVHCWITDLFEHATFGTALLFVTPMVGAYAAIRLVLPIAPDAVLRGVVWLSLATAVYSAGMALVQTEARRLFCFLFLSHSSLVLVGLEFATPIGLTGALSVWLSVALALTGFGIVLRAVEARLGRLSLGRYHGLHDRAPMLGAFFLLTGLASVGFPGTIGFVAIELLVDGVTHRQPAIGMLLLLAATLNGIAVVQAYFRLFTGVKNTADVSLQVRPAERVAIIALTVLILAGGLLPQPGVLSRYRAATQLVQMRKNLSATTTFETVQHKEYANVGD